ncbi:MAG: response regulator [Candidatus Polarisedimenticolaceae bacterium]|nr:response regulator [Candidatus Polarisedimenticolaceae bacterium]
MYIKELASKKFLVVDDYGDMRNMLKNMLQMFGATAITTAKNGAEAIALLEKTPFDVVLCDYNLGTGKDGQQILEEARHRELIGLSTIFVMTTAENTREMVFGAIEYEPDGYLSKPFTKDILSARLNKLVAKKANLAEVQQAVHNKNLELAIKLLDDLIKKKPRNIAELIRYKSDLCLQAKKYDQAMLIFEQALSIRELPWAIIGTGKVHFARGDFEAAREVFQDLIDENESFISAYDWLAKTLLAMEEPGEAQEVLKSAVELSPKAILRQKILGNVALNNNDYECAEKAFGKTVSLGRYSVFKSPHFYAKLAISKSNLGSANAHGNALEVIHQLERAFGSDKEAKLIAKTVESQVHANAGETESAQKSFQEADKLYQRLHNKIDPSSTLEMAKACAAVGDKERSVEILKDAVRNNHDNKELLREVESTFHQAGIEGDVKEMIKRASEEIFQLNNNGVSLAQQGKYDQAIKLFNEAANSMPGNRVINLNAAKVLIRFMQREGKNTEHIGMARKYLDRIRKLDSGNPALNTLQTTLKGIVDS